MNLWCQTRDMHELVSVEEKKNKELEELIELRPGSRRLPVV